jgi:hypothetical protein
MQTNLRGFTGFNTKTPVLLVILCKNELIIFKLLYFIS